MPNETQKTAEQIRVERHHHYAGRTIAALALGLIGTFTFNHANHDSSESEKSKDTPSHSVSPKEYEQAVVNSTQIPLDRNTETPVIDNIVVPEGMIPSDYIPTEPRVVEYVANNHNEEAAVETSINSLKTLDTNTYALVERDVDGDGDTDAVVTQVIK